MKKSILVPAVVAAGLASAAMAEDLKQGKAAVAAPTQISDAEMDRITAGGATYTLGIYNNAAHQGGGHGLSSLGTTGHPLPDAAANACGHGPISC